MWDTPVANGYKPQKNTTIWDAPKRTLNPHHQRRGFRMSQQEVEPPNLVRPLDDRKNTIHGRPCHVLQRFF